MLYLLNERGFCSKNLVKVGRVEGYLPCFLYDKIEFNVNICMKNVDIFVLVNLRPTPYFSDF